jgi:23S rRNA (guanosine2251-2'-O)-methyltransferase
MLESIRQMKKNFKRPDREREGRTERSNLIYGVMPVLELLRSNPSRVDRMMIAAGAGRHRLREIYENARESKIRIDTVDEDQLDRLAPGANHQGVIAISAAADYVDAGEILDGAGPDPLLLLLDGIEDPRNLGAILRTAECAGANGVIIPDRRAVGLTDTVAKSSAGAVEHIKIAKVGNLNNFICDLKKQNIWVVGTSVQAAMEHHEWDWTRPSALVLGGEGRGLHRLVAENCDTLVKIPMYGRIDSLNVSVAAGVILFEARRQREQKLKADT